MTKAIIYTRYSPRKKKKKKNGDVQECESCETQEGICRNLAKKKEYAVVKVIHDKDISGKDEYREKLWQAIKALGKGNVLLVFKRDRLARNVYLAEQINRAVEARGATIEAVSGDVEGNGPEQVMIRQVLASIAEYEREMIGLRTSFAMKQHQKNGKRMGRYAPYGWGISEANPSLLKEVQEEQDILGIIKQYHEDGFGACQIATILNETEERSARGKEWRYNTIKKIIERMV